MTKKAKSSKGEPVTDHRPFRFQSLHERLNKININVGHQIRHYERTDLNDIESLTRSSHFHQGLEHWSTLNFSEAFTDLQRILLPLAGSLEQVVFNRDKIVTELRRSLSEQNPLIISTLLDLIVQLARDLQSDFYVYYKEFLFVDIVDLLIHRKDRKQNEIDTQLVEDVFQCLTYLFKYLWRIMLKDLAELYELYSKYLFTSTSTNNGEYIRSFAAESFAYLLRKIENYRPLIDYFFDERKFRDENEIESLALLFAETCENVQSTYHSCTKSLIECLLKKLIVRVDPIFSCLKSMFVLLIEHGNDENRSNLSSIFLQIYRTIDEKEMSWPILRSFYELFHLFIDHWRNVRVEFLNEFLSRIETNFDENFLRLHYQTLRKIFEKRSFDSNFVELYFRFARQTSTNLFYDETKELFRQNLPEKFARRFWKILRDQNENFVELFVDSIRIEREKFEMNFSRKDSNETIETKLKKKFFVNERLDERAVETIRTFIDETLAKINENLDETFRAMILLNSLRKNDVESLKNLSKLDEFSADGNPSTIASILIEMTIFGQRFSTSFWFSFLTNSFDSESSLFAARLAFFVDRPSKIFFDRFVDLLKKNLSSLKSTIRLLTLHILHSFDNDDDDEVIRNCLACEESPLNIYEYRQRIIFLQKLSVEFLVAKKTTSKSFRLSMLFLFGVLRSNFTPLWPIVIDLLGSYGKKAIEHIGHVEFWSMINDEFDLLKIRPEFPSNDDLNETTIDWIQYRWNLFDILRHFPSECEQKTKLLFPIVFEFFHDEFYDHRLALGFVARRISSKRLNEKHSVKTLEKILELFKEFRHWQQWFDAERIYDFYLRLLLCSNSKIQQLAFECLLTCISMPKSFLQKEILSHVEELLPLFQPTTSRKTFHELIHGVLLDPNRSETLKDQFAFILIRILYSKLNEKRHITSSIRDRKSLFQFLLTFVSNRIYEKHFRYFLQLIFEPFSTTNENVDGELFLKSLQHSFSLMKILVEKLAVFLRDYVDEFLRFDILTIDYVEHLSTEEKLCRNLIRKVRGVAFKNLQMIFRLFDEDFPTTKTLIDEVWRVAVQQTYLDKPMREDVVHLLKLSIVWSRTTFLRNLIFNDRIETKSLFEFFFVNLVETRRNEKEKFVIEIVSNLMRLDPSDPLLIDHHDVILDYLTRISMLMTEKKPTTCLTSDEIEILLHLTSNVERREKLAMIFLRLTRRNRSTMTNESIFRLLQTFLPQIDASMSKALRFLPISCRKIRQRNERIELMKIFEIYADESTNLRRLVELNSWQNDQVDQVDYERRLKSYKEIFNDEQINDDRAEHLCLFYHFIYELETSINDLSLRENASICLEKFLRQIVEFRRIFLNEIRSILKDVRCSPTVRHEFLRHLSFLVDFDDDLIDLKCLKNPSDIEIDFFANISHVQQHRRYRALKRLKKFDEENSFRLSTIEDFLLPIVTSFISDVINGHVDDLHDEIVYQCLTNFSRRFSWRTFQRVFIGYFRQLTSNRTLNLTQKRCLTRTISSMIDAFHFQPNDDRQRIEKRFLPMILRLLSENSFEVDRSTTDEQRQEAVLLTTTCSIVASKFLVAFSTDLIEKHISTILLHLITLLRSRLYSIRDSARDALCKCSMIFGQRYFKYLVEELIAGLKRGYQHFVLLHTINALLIHIDSSNEDFRIDSAVKIIVNLFVDDLFNQEKTESSKANEHDNSTYKPSNIPEAKTNKTANIFELIGRLIRSSDELFIAIEPLRRQLNEKNESRWISQCEKCLQRFQMGLIVNRHLSTENFFVFLHHLLTKSNENESEPTNRTTNDNERQRYHLIPQEPKRGHARVAQSIQIAKKTNLHCLVSWTLNFLHKLIKKSKTSDDPTKFLSMIDPFVEQIEKCFDSSYLDVIVGAMRILSSIIDSSLPSLNNERLTKFYKKIFDFLKIYSSVGNADELLTLGYKILGLFVQRSMKNDDDVRLTSDEFQCLFNYIEMDLLNVHRRSSAFLLLRSIMRHATSIISNDKTLRTMLDNLLRSRLQSMIVQSPLEHIRTISRELFHIYLFSYEHSKSKFKSFLDFFLLQLDYEEINGRLSVLTFFKSLFEDLPKNRLNENAAFFFIPFSSQFYNETNRECKERFQENLRLLIEKIDEEQRVDLLKNIVLVWLNDQIEHRSLAVQLLLIFIEIQRERFDEYLTEILPFILKQFDEIDNEQDEKFIDQYFYHLINVLLHLMKFSSESLSIVSLRTIWLKLVTFIDEKSLLHPNIWIRSLSTQFFARLFEFQQPIEFVRSIEIYLSNENDENEPKRKRLKKFNLNNETLFVHFIGQTKSLEKIQRLALCACSQLKPEGLNDEFSLQVTKNFIYLSKILILSQSNYFDLIVRRATRLTTFESTKHPHETTRRSAILKWIAALILEHSSLLTSHYKAFLTVIEREIERDDLTTLKTLAQEVFDVFKRHADIHLVTSIYADIAKERRTKRLERKQKLAVLAINQPEVVYRKKRVKQTKRAGLGKKKRLKKIEKARKERRKNAKTTTRSNDFDDDF